MKKIVVYLIVLTLFLTNIGNFTYADEEETDHNALVLSHFDNVSKSDNGKIGANLLSHHNENTDGKDDLIISFEEFDIVENKMRVEVLLSDESYLESLEEFNSDLKMENHYKSLAQILIPQNLIKELSEREYVQFIRTPIKPHFFDITSEGANVIGANILQNNGITGDGVKVAVIDGGFQNYDSNPDLPSSQIKEVKSFRADNDIEAGYIHGSACAELILDVAPQCDLHLYNFDTISELNDAVQYSISKGIDIISFSAGYIGINDYDGIGYDVIGDVCSIIDNARNNGVLFVVSAGNEASRHYNGYFHDEDNDNWHEFDPPYETILLEHVNAGDYIDIRLSWNDWPYSNQDFDLYLLDSNGYEIANSSYYQDGSQPPIEMISGQANYGGDWQIAIRKYSASETVHFELYGHYHDFLTSNVPQSSLACPADAFGATTIGATYWQDDNIEYFSSRGPTNDGRTKPDLTAPDGVSTYAYGTENFYGTSAAAPHTAGAAALLLNAGPLCSADDLESILENNALDLGDSGKDNSYGSGRINVWDAYQSMIPSADYTFSPENPTTQHIIQFTDQSSDPDGSISSWNWDFGDGNTSTMQNPTHQYSQNETYTVSVEVTDNHGVTNLTTKQITILNDPPTSSFSYSPTNPNTSTTLQFTDLSTDNDGTIQEWNWDFDDGYASSDQHPSYQYDDNGTYNVTLSVMDDDGVINSSSKTIQVDNMGPKTNFTFSPINPDTNDLIQFTDTSSDSDGIISSWDWDFDDGNTSSDQHPTHRFPQNGTYNITLTVTDDDGATSELTSTIEVTQAPPVCYNLSGTIYYNGGLTGNIGIMVWDSLPDDSDPPLDGYWKQETGTYNFSLPNGTYYIAAFMDTDSDYNYSNYEPLGFAINQSMNNQINPIIVNGQNRTDVDITLFERNIVYNQNTETYYYTIQQAIDDATMNDTLIVKDGFYYENIIIDKPLNLTGVKKQSTWIIGENDSTVYVSADYVNISKFTIINASCSHHGCWRRAGVFIDGANHICVSECNVTMNNIYGVLINNSEDCTLRNNLFSKNQWDSIMLHNAYQSSILDNSIECNWNGGLFVYSDVREGYNQTIQNTYINGMEIKYYYDISDIILSDVDSTHITVANADNITLTNAKVTHGDGIHLAFVSNSTVTQCNSSFNHQTGLLFHNSTNNSITNNQFCHDSYGMDIAWNSKNNLVDNNIINHNYGLGIGMSMNGCNNTISNNQIINNSDGVSLVYAASVEDSGNNQFNSITNNTISSNDEYGIKLFDAHHNIIKNNTISDNGKFGIMLNGSHQNILYNNILDNENNSWDNGNNYWNVSKRKACNILGGPFIGGNNWSDYPNTDDTMDGLGDIPYLIPGGNNTDFFPLVNSTYILEEPDLNILKPINGTEVNNQTITLEGNTSDENGIVNISFYQIDNGNESNSQISEELISYISFSSPVYSHEFITSIPLSIGWNIIKIKVTDTTEDSTNETIYINYVPIYNSLSFFNITEGYGIKYNVSDEHNDLHCSVWSIVQYHNKTQSQYGEEFVFTLNQLHNQSGYFRNSTIDGHTSMMINGTNFTLFNGGCPVGNQGNFYWGFSLPTVFKSGDNWNQYSVDFIGPQIINGKTFDECIKIHIDTRNCTYHNDTNYTKGFGYFILAKDIGIVKLVFNRTEGEYEDTTVVYTYCNHVQMEKHTISGTITTLENDPVEDISVQLSNCHPFMRSVTNSSGHFEIQAYGPDVILRIGYDTNQDGTFDFDLYPKLPKEFSVTNVTTDVTDISVELDIDIFPPKINNVSATPTKIESGELVNISCEITDENNINQSKLIITDPNDDPTIINETGQGIFFNESQYTSTGTYDFTFWTIDNWNNENSTIIHHFWVCNNISTEEISTTGEQNVSWQDINISGNFTNNTNVTFVQYAENPHPEHTSTNMLNKYIDITIENDSTSIDWPMNITMYYTNDDLNNSNVSEEDLLGLYFWNETKEQWEIYNDTGVNTEFSENGYDGFVWANVWHLTPLVAAGDSQPPSQVTELSVTDAKDGKLDLSWSAATDNIDVDHYNVYWSQNNYASSIATVNHPTTSYQKTGLKDGTMYTFKVSAVDTSGNEGDLSISDSGTPTASTPSGGGGTNDNDGGNGFIPTGSTNTPPVANISVDTNLAFVGENIRFDGSGSTDEEGNITSWTWDFDDGSTGVDSIVTHSFSTTGLFEVSLTVADEENETDTCQVLISVEQANRAPEITEFSSPDEGSVDVSYEFTFSASDADNDTIHFVVDWDDNTEPEITEEIEQNESITLNHSWDSPGFYTIQVYAEDDENASSSTVEKEIQIDVKYCLDVGYFIDDDADGVYDRLFFNETQEITDLGYEDGMYKLDTNGDGEWDYSYESGNLATIGLKEEDKTPGFSMVFLFLIIGLFVVVGYRKKIR